MSLPWINTVIRVLDSRLTLFHIYLISSRLQEVVIFIVGGTTYEESRSVALQNSLNSGIRFILGGSAILNSKR